jgi:hypothetical protein
MTMLVRFVAGWTLVERVGILSRMSFQAGSAIYRLVDLEPLQFCYLGRAINRDLRNR